ncbi:nuclear transport factor 2 family protein [Streptomyces sp. NPDC001435]|uniref:nuclear transport factor 2 family protein n=1 Tax=unclassified Streptomyces TaxID=2593676 RepID=UPI0036A22AF0
MPESTSPADLYRHSLRLLLDKDIPAWVGLWAEHGVMEFPFAPPSRPQRLEGRQAVAAYMRDYPDHIDLHDFPARYSPMRRPVVSDTPGSRGSRQVPAIGLSASSAVSQLLPA